MDALKRKRLEGAGFKVGSVRDFLGLTDPESMYVEVKAMLAGEFAHLRSELKLTQEQLARHLGSSQSRIAKIEAGDSSVSLDLLVRSLLAMGSTPKDLADALGRSPLKQARRVTSKPRRRSSNAASAHSAASPSRGASRRAAEA